MYKSITIALLLFLCACGGTASIDRFYEDHKEDDQVLAFRVSPVMFSMLRGLTGEMESLLGDTRDLRFIRLPANGNSGIPALNRQVAELTAGSFIEIFRKNDGADRNLVAIRERGNSVREILVFGNRATHGSLLYIRGDFSPAQVRNLAKEEAFGNLEERLTGAFGPATDIP